jgi:hypothetical protein
MFGNQKPITTKKNYMLVLGLFLMVVFLCSSIEAQESEPWQKLQALKLPSLDGDIKVLYSDGFKERAHYLQRLAEAASAYLQKPEIIGVKLDLHIAVLGPDDWTKISQFPYGVCHIFPFPPTAVLPATGDNILVRGMLQYKDRVSAATSKHLKELGITYEEAVPKFMDLIGFHEMGHLYSDAYGLKTWPANKWLSEFVATYLAYAYMKENQPKLVKLWDRDTMMDDIAQRNQRKYTSLAEFEKLYIKVGNDNYGWYQAKFQQMVSKIYQKMGITFIHALKKSLLQNPKSPTDDPLRLGQLDAIFKGFTSWAKGGEGNLK